MSSGESKAPVHLPVMLREVVEFLRPSGAGVYVDATVGLGGHSEEILRHIGEGGTLVGIDRDDEALRAAAGRLTDGRCVFRKARFSEMREVLDGLGIRGVDGVLFDFGASMLQMKGPGRGFSFVSDEALDMRMDRSQPLTAQRVVNDYPAVEIEKILREYGEERNARKISMAISRERQKAPIATCRQLADIVSRVSGRAGRIHPATRTFQALRIAVNDELGEIQRGLKSALEVLRPGGRLVAISYHSLEDRAVKNFIREAGQKDLVRALTKKPLTPGADEMRKNPSSRSAKLRAAEALEAQ
jgi:16S rRNA (cytosine1402-N4)-methyltransferase